MVWFTFRPGFWVCSHESRRCYDRRSNRLNTVFSPLIEKAFVKLLAKPPAKICSVSINLENERASIVPGLLQEIGYDTDVQSVQPLHSERDRILLESGSRSA